VQHAPPLLDVSPGATQLTPKLAGSYASHTLRSWGAGRPEPSAWRGRTREGLKRLTGLASGRPRDRRSELVNPLLVGRVSAGTPASRGRSVRSEVNMMKRGV
jgi:hypothetical protein